MKNGLVAYETAGISPKIRRTGNKKPQYEPRRYNMNLNPATLWWLMAGVTVAIELLSGTFYLLMLAIGMAAGAVAAHMGLGLTMQIVTCAVVGASTVLVAYIKRRSRPGEPSPRAERSVNLDVGETVFIDAWQADGTAQVKYRGANWTPSTVLASPRRSALIAWPSWWATGCWSIRCNLKSQKEYPPWKSPSSSSSSP